MPQTTLTSAASLQYSRPMSSSAFFTFFLALLILDRLFTGSWYICQTQNHCQSAEILFNHTTVVWKVTHVGDALAQYQFCLIVTTKVPFKTPLLGTDYCDFSESAGKQKVFIRNRLQVWRLSPSVLRFMQSWDWIVGVNIGYAAPLQPYSPTALSVKANAK